MHDTILYRFITRAQDQMVLQQDLKHLEEWKSEWDMSFHVQPAAYKKPEEQQPKLHLLWADIRDRLLLQVPGPNHPK